MELKFEGLQNRLLVTFQCGGIKSNYRSDRQPRAEGGNRDRLRQDRFSSALLISVVALSFLSLSPLSIPFESQTNILQADYPRGTMSSVLQFKAAVLLKNLDNFSAKLSEVTLIMESTAMDGMVSEDADLRIRLKSFEQQAQANIITGGLQSLEEPLITESTIPIAQLERYTVRNKESTQAERRRCCPDVLLTHRPFFSGLSGLFPSSVRCRVPTSS